MPTPDAIRSPDAVGSEPDPPTPERRPHVLRAHGDERVDDWYWLADRDDPAVVPHLKAENAYAEAVLGRLSPLRDALYREIVARIDETDLSVPVRRGPWWYFHRTAEGKSYPVHCRRPVTVDDVPLDRGPAPDEQVLLDENAMAEGHPYFEVGNLAVSPAHQWLAYAVDTSGAELFDLSFRRLTRTDGATSPDEASDEAPESGPESAPEMVPATYYGLAWANDETTVFYTRVDDAMRPYQVWRHRLGTDPADDVLVLEEPDERFTVSVGRTKDGALLVLAIQSHTTSEVWLVPADDPAVPPRVVATRRDGIEYAVEHHRAAGGGQPWLVILTNDEAEDFRVVGAPADRPDREHWHELVPHRPGTRVDDVDVLARHLVIAERLEGEPRVRLVPIGGGDLLAGSWLIPSAEHPSVTWEGPNPEPTTPSLRVDQTSLVSPAAVLDVDLATGEQVLRKRQPVRGGYDPTRFRTYRVWAAAGEGTRVPLSLVHRADLLSDPDGQPGSPLAAPVPCLLYGYGAYEHSIDPVFSSLRLSLLERGVIFAIAHVRGGGELGRRWYLDGKTAAKPHTFSDFVACARHLIDHGFTAADRLALRGGSAGGLLVGAVLNQAPELFCAAVAEVPFVDCLTTMLDESLPLTVGEWDEWGNPVTDAEDYAVIKSYSPYDNIRPVRADGSPVLYPPVLATAGLHDPRVGYWEPAKWTAKLREVAGARVVLRTELDAGHGGPSGRYDAWREEALVYAFLLDAMGVTDA